MFCDCGVSDPDVGPCHLVRDFDSLDCCPVNFSARVMGDARIGSTIIRSDVGSKELLCGLLGPPIDKPRVLCRRVRDCVAGETEVFPCTVMGL